MGTKCGRSVDGWVASGARNSWRLIREGTTRFRDLGGTRAVLKNVAVRLDATKPSSDAPDGAVRPRVLAGGLRGPAAVRLDLGFDNVVLVADRYDDAHLAELRRLA